MEEVQKKKPMGALDAINASFEDRKNNAAEEEEQRKAAVRHAGWRIALGILSVAVILTVVLALFMFYRKFKDGDPMGQAVESESGVMTETSWKQGKETADNTEAKEDGRAERSTERQEDALQIPKEYLSILTENEKEEWKYKKKDSARLYIQLNQKIEIDDKERVYLRLINPPYSSFAIQVKIYLTEDPDTLLYESDKIDPGTILNEVPFDRTLGFGTYPGKVQYTIYGKDEKVIGTHEVDVTIVSEHDSQ